MIISRIPISLIAFFVSIVGISAAPDSSANQYQNYYQTYALRFTQCMDASGYKTTAHTMTKVSGEYHLTIVLDKPESPKLVIKFKPGKSCLHIQLAHLGKKQVYPTKTDEWPLMILWHLVSSRQPNLEPSVVVKPAGSMFFRTGDLYLATRKEFEQKSSWESWKPLRSDVNRNEMVLWSYSDGSGGGISINGQRSISNAGKCGEGTFRKLVKGLTDWNFNPGISSALKQHKIELEKGLYFSGAAAAKSPGMIVAARNSVPYKDGKFSQVSALVYYKSIDKAGTQELIVARSPINIKDVDWESARAALEKK